MVVITLEPDNHRTGVSQWGYLVETNFCFDKYAYLFPASHDIWADKLAKMEDSYLTQRWLFILPEREILSQFGFIVSICVTTLLRNMSKYKNFQRLKQEKG